MNLSAPSMRSPALLLLASLLTSCAYEGVIVRKEARPHPLYHSIGVEGIYAFVLRDNTSALHRQMVTPEVFEAYAEGQYFNDAQAGPIAAHDVKDIQPAAAPAMQRSTDPVPFPRPIRVSSKTTAPSRTETTQSFRASELARSSHSMTATLRTEVPQNALIGNDGAQSVPSENVAAQPPPTVEKPVAKKTKSAAKTSARTTSTKAKVPAKSGKLWRETAPVVEPPTVSSGPVANATNVPESPSPR